MADHPSPDIRNYFIGKGIVSILTAEDSDWRDVGNVPVFEFTPNVTKLDHFSSRTGIKKKDRTVVTEQSGSLKIVMEEWTMQNLRLALMGAISQDSQTNDEIDILSEPIINAQVKFVGTNDVGPRFQVILNSVDFTPSATINPLTDEWGQIEVTGDVLADAAGKFGTWTRIAVEA